MLREAGDLHVGFQAGGRSAKARAQASLWSPGASAVTVLAFIMLGDAVRDALDPKLR
jgi:ABC-type dipeptide/oligopeptide/nickel transport system permease subunit